MFIQLFLGITTTLTVIFTIIQITIATEAMKGFCMMREMNLCCTNAVRLL